MFHKIFDYVLNKNGFDGPHLIERVKGIYFCFASGNKTNVFSLSLLLFSNLYPMLYHCCKAAPLLELFLTSSSCRAWWQNKAPLKGKI